MAESIVQVTEGSGKKLHTWSRTIGANTVEDEAVFPAEFPLASYMVASATSVSTATANDHVLQVMAGSSLKVRIRRIRVEQSANATTAAALPISILRLTTAGTGGTALTPRPFDPGDAASGATAMTLPTVKGTEGVLLLRTVLAMRQAVSTTGSTVDEMYEWVQHPGTPPIIIAAGTTNGIAIKIESAIAGGSLLPSVEFTETSF